MKVQFARALATACFVMGTVTAMNAKQVTLDVSMAQPLLTANQKQTTFVKVGLSGFKLLSEQERAPVNVCFVLDKSGSMSGDKIRQAKAAAVSAIERLGPDDIVSVVTYDSNVRVVVPATKLTDKESVLQEIRNIDAAGSTALFAGVSKGAAELRKFLDINRVNRVILLSDGLANVGPQSPSELGELGASLMKEHISVTTIGLGLDYNEDLMTQLANRSDGNHVFVEESTSLVSVFNREFNDVLSVVAQEVSIKIECAKGVRPVRVLNADADIRGQSVWVTMNQLYSEQEKYVIVEVELTGKAEHETMDVAEVTITYANMESKTNDRLTSHVAVGFTESPKLVETSVNKEVMEKCVLQLANLANQQATALRDKGEVAESVILLESNYRFLSTQADKLGSVLLRQRAGDNLNQSKVLDEAEWQRSRKAMRALQYSDAKQQSDR